MKLSEWIQTHPKLSFYFRNQIGPRVAQLEAELEEYKEGIEIERGWKQEAYDRNTALQRENRELEVANALWEKVTDGWKAENAQLEQQFDFVGALLEKANTGYAQLETENAALKKFVHWVHKDECASLLAGNKECDCGYDALLTAEESK